MDAAAAQGSDTCLHVLREVLIQLQTRNQDSAGEQGGCAWTQEQWWESFTYMFVPHGNDEHAAGLAFLKAHDDLLFFVHSKTQPTGQHTLEKNGMPFSVRRRSTRLAPEWQKSGSNFSAIAWDETFMLNLVMHTDYKMTTVVCRHDLLSQVAAGVASGSDVVSVTKHVYASPVQTSVNIEKPNARAADHNTHSCYPDVCFSVDDFSDAFLDLVMSSKEHCYCVMLHALLPDTQSGSQAASGSTSRSLDAATASGRGQTGMRPHRLVLFSGYVSFEQVSSHISSQRSAVGRLFGANVREKVLMAGPGGIGHAEVAVREQQHSTATSSTADKQSQRLGLQSVLAALSSVFQEELPAKQSAMGVGSLQCALMTMQLPIDKLAFNILGAML